MPTPAPRPTTVDGTAADRPAADRSPAARPATTGPDRPPRRQAGPLDAVGSLKVKFGLLVGLSVVTAALVALSGDRAGVPAWLTLPVTVAAALGVTQWLARGMTSPLLEMTDAAARMATGDHSVRVRATSADEVGRLARAFNTMAEDLATADHQRRQLLATVSHELRTPLAAQRALLENLVDGVVRPDDAALASALAQSERLSELVGDLLDLSRPEGGKLRPGPIDVAELVREGIGEARIGGRDVRFTTEIQRDLRVTGDRARLAQLLANLLDNAVRHSPAGGTVTVRAGGADAGRWFLEVLDEGPGIPTEHARDVFTRFWTDREGGGTGLGLAIASWVCELHGGTIAALPGSPGARLRAVLPVSPGAQAEPISAGRATASPSTTPPAASTASVTTADDAPPGAATVTAAAATPAGVGGPVAADRPSVPEALFGGLWPEAGPVTAMKPLLGSLAVGLMAAIILPDRPPGLGFVLVLLAGGGLVLAMSRLRRSAWTVTAVVLCLSLASLLVLRAAEWLTPFVLIASALLITTTLTGARRVAQMVAAAAAWPLSAVRGLPLLGRTLSAASGHKLLWPVVRTVALSVAALVVFGGLLSSADAVLGSWVAGLIPDLDWESVTLRGFILVVVAGVVLAGCYLALNPPRVDKVGLPPAQPVARVWEWLVPVGIVIAVLAAFVVAQASAMWGGHDYVQRVTGMTYAEYVHQGFGQLTMVTALTLATVALTVRKAGQGTGRDRLVIRVALGALCLLTLVVVASALFRMSVYQDAFGFTVLRVLVDAFELWLGLLVVLVTVAGIRWLWGWLPRAALASGTAFLLVLGLGNTEAWVARQNIARYQETGKIDTAYLAALGADATPTVAAGLPDDLAQCVIAAQSRPGEAEDLLSWNLGRARAAEIEGWGAGTRSGCLSEG